jgi:hypothetical protein
MASTAIEPTPIEKFCQELLKENRFPDSVLPERMAERFSKYFGLRPPLTKDDILSLCRQIGLDFPEEISLPPSLRGIHIGLGNVFAIGYREGEREGGAKHTILHEIWEIMFGILSAHRGRSLFLEAGKEAYANRFAAAVLMPRKYFLEHCVRASFDPLVLRDAYRVSYLSVVIRMKHVLESHTNFIGIVYNNTAAEEYFRNRVGRPRLEKVVEELNEACNFEIERKAFSYHSKQGPDIFNMLRRLAGKASDEGFFHGIAKRTLEQMNIVQDIRWPYASNMVFGCYPVMYAYGLISKILITGILEDDWDKLRAMFTTSSFPEGDT